MELYARGVRPDGVEYVVASSDMWVPAVGRSAKTRRAIRRLVHILTKAGLENTRLIKDEDDWVSYKFRRRVED